jgi:glucose/mannose-6-phosphate isomerase
VTDTVSAQVEGSGRVAAGLDDPAGIAAGDPRGMLELIAETGAQLRDGYRRGRAAPGLPSAEGLRSVAVCGMGGSGIAGDVVRGLFGEVLGVPLVSVKGYLLPAHCDSDTLMVASSFSGNTEETVAAYSEAVRRGCRVLVVASGGELAVLAEADQVPLVTLPSDIPVPRGALGVMAGVLIGLFEAVELLPPAGHRIAATAGEIDRLAGELGPGRPEQGNRAKQLARWLEGRIPVVWGSEGLAEAAALRWKTQINENAKLPAFASTLSELDHNEVEGWSTGSGAPFGLVVLRHGAEHPRTEARVRATLESIETAALPWIEARIDAAEPWTSAFGLNLLGDFVSTYLAILRGVDPMPIPTLMGLKERLRR